MLLIPPAVASEMIITMGRMNRTNEIRPQIRAVRLQQKAHFPVNLDLPYVLADVDYIERG